MWLTDRSRYERGTKNCAMQRYLEYHSGPYGYGMRKGAMSLPLASGSLLHDMLAEVMKHVQAAQSTVGDMIPLAHPNSPVSRSLWRRLMQPPLDRYRAEVKAQGYLDMPNAAEAEWVMEEQACLMEGLAWCWIRTKLPEIIENYTVVTVEQEETYVIGCTCKPITVDMPHTLAAHAANCKGIVIQTRPDMILRNKLSVRLIMRDFKTSAYAPNDDTVEEYRENVQMAVQTLGVEARMGEPVESYFIDTLLKGQRKVFSKKGVDTQSHWKKVYSQLCYAKIYSANPPMSDKTTWDYTGFWFDKSPVWAAEFTQKPEGMSNSEFWVYELPDNILFEQTVEIGPYERPSYMIEQGLRAFEGEERRWIGLLNHLYDVEVKHGWQSEAFQSELDKTVPRSYDCFSFGHRCPMYTVCFKKAGWQDPIGSGKYVHRRPHHQPEIDQMVARGIPVPPEFMAGEEG